MFAKVMKYQTVIVKQIKFSITFTNLVTFFNSSSLLSISSQLITSVKSKGVLHDQQWSHNYGAFKVLMCKNRYSLDLQFEFE